MTQQLTIPDLTASHHQLDVWKQPSTNSLVLLQLHLQELPGHSHGVVKSLRPAGLQGKHSSSSSSSYRLPSSHSRRRRKMRRRTL